MENVFYLDNQDVVKNGTTPALNLPSSMKGKPSMLMVQRLNCGWCTQAKPEFDKLGHLLYSDSSFPAFGKYNALALSTDTEQEASQVIFSTLGLEGVPAFLVFDSKGNYVKLYEGKRELSGMMGELQSIN